MESDFKTAVIGLGLIGGSMAWALRGFKNGIVVGCDTNPETRLAVMKEKAVSEVYDNPGDAIDGADLVIICTYPESIPKIVEENRDRFKKGAVITDVCGVKTHIAEEICRLKPENVDYIGGHPMAGKEVEGFENATDELFWMTGFIITPTDNSKKENISLIWDMAKYIGAARITTASPKEHDSVIAYTSDLMHIAAAGLCLDFNENMNRAYTAGAFRDCTRIAMINPELWTELFIANSENTVTEIDKYVKSLNQLKKAVGDKDEEKLFELLSKVRENKKRMQSMEPEYKSPHIS